MQLFYIVMLNLVGFVFLQVAISLNNEAVVTDLAVEFALFFAATLTACLFMYASIGI